MGVGHATVWRDEPPPPAGRGVARTGVTVIDIGGNLFRSPVPAGGTVLNGAGECTGFLAAAEWGLVETPIFLTSTMQVGRVYDAACELLMEEEPAIGADDVIIPVVAECDDSFLSDARRMQVSAADVRAALDAARAGIGGPAPAEGAVGSGTGMSCLGFKGGIGSASRLTPSGHVVGVLVMSNFGERERLTIDGVPAGALREFSRRRVEIEERAEQLTGVTASELSRERRQGIALATRMAKTYGVDGSAGRTRLGPGPPSMASARPSSRSWSPAKPGRRCCGHHAPALRRPRLLARTNRSSWPTGIARSAGTG